MAGVYDFTLDQGSDTNISLTFYEDTAQTTPMNLTGKTFACQVRENKDDESYIDDLTNENGRIDLTDAATGKILLKFPGSVSALFNFKTAYYDLESYTGGVPLRELQGKITLDGEVTR